jgi:arylsulfatase
MKDQKLHYAYNYVGAQKFLISSKNSAPEGAVELRFEFEPTGKADVAHGKGTPAHGQLYINGTLAGQGDIPLTLPLITSLGGGITVGRGMGSPLTDQYHPPFEFTGKIHDVVVDVSGDLIQDKEAEMRAVMAHQ